MLKQTLNKEIGRLLSKKRNDLNLTQKDCARKLKISLKTYSSWENGNTTININHIDEFNDVLDLFIPDLIEIAYKNIKREQKKPM